LSGLEGRDPSQDCRGVSLQAGAAHQHRTEEDGHGQSRRGRLDRLPCFPRFEGIPAFRLADEVGRTDAPVVEAAADGERKIAVDPSFLEEVRDGVIVTVGEPSRNADDLRQLLSWLSRK
jgi:hypothetical protein